MMRKNILMLILGVGVLTAQAASINPLWMRDVRISPDGKSVVFCYKGDVYKVSSDGGLRLVQMVDWLFSLPHRIRMNRTRYGHRTVSK